MSVAESAEEKTSRYTSAMAMAGIIKESVIAYEDDFSDMERDIERTHSVGAILDPTMYRDFLWDEGRQRNAKLVGCILRFVSDLRKQGVISAREDES